MSDNVAFPRLTIEPMKKALLPQILAIERESFPSPWTVGMFEKELESRHSQCLCARVHAEDKNVIAAYIIFWLVADEVHLLNLAVKTEYRRLGFACRMMDVMKEIAVENKAAMLTLEVRESNTEAIKLYRKCGFVVKGVRPLYYSDTKEDALIMWAYLK